MDSAAIIADRKKRLEWWHKAHFGMFVHWGLYSQPGRGEWVMNQERIPVAEYEKLAATWHPKPHAAREWAALAKPGKQGYWQPIIGDKDGFVNLHDRYVGMDGTVYLATKIAVAKAGEWDLLLGHDGPAKVFINGKAVVALNELKNPCNPDRTRKMVKLGKGTHEVVVAFGLAKGQGWGIRLRFGAIAGTKRKDFPQQARL
jgi:hypothetical protein